MWVVPSDAVIVDRTKQGSVPQNRFTGVHKHFIGSAKWSYFGDDTLGIPGFGDRVLNQNPLVDGERLKGSTLLVFPLLHK